MEKNTLFRNDQHVKAVDFQNMQAFARSAIDHVVADGIHAHRAYKSLEVTATGVAEITVAPGRIYSSGQVFVLESNVVASLVANLPSTQNRMATVVAWGLEVEDTIEPRAYLIDANSGTFEPREVTMRSVRTAQIEVVYGTESVAPVRGNITSSSIPIADILLSPTAITSITMDSTYALPSVESVDEAVDDLETWQSAMSQQVDTLRSDYAKLAALIPANLADTLQSLGATLRDLWNFAHRPLNVVYSAVDRFRNTVNSDTDHAGYSARVEDGLTFPSSAPVQSAVSLLNPSEPRVKTVNGVTLPMWDEIIRGSSSLFFTDYVTVAKGGYWRDDPLQNGQAVWISTGIVYFDKIVITNYPIVALGWTRHHMSRVCHRYGDWLDCDIAGAPHFATWGNLIEGYYVVDQESAYGLAEIARRPGFPYMLCYRDGGEPYTVNWPNFWTYAEIDRWNSIRRQRYYKDWYARPYWPAVITTGTHSGASVCQTFVHGTNGWLTSVTLFFAERGTTGDVQVKVCRTVDGRPDHSQIISSGVAALADITVGVEGCRVPITPVFLEGGERYGLILTTNGAHHHYIIPGCAYTFGSLHYFHSTGYWVDALLESELIFLLGFAKFRSTHVEVQMNTLSLAGGINNIKLLAALHEPPGTNAHWEIQNGGNWMPIADTDANALTGNPVTLPLRLVFDGTRDSMPAIDLSQAEVEIGSSATAFTHYSEAEDFGGATTSIRVDLDIKGWNAAHHSVNVHLIISAVEGGDGSLVTIVDPQDPSHVTKQYTFTVASTTGVDSIKTIGGTSAGYGFFTVAERRIHSF